jgi:hypothetical protein
MRLMRKFTEAKEIYTKTLSYFKYEQNYNIIQNVFGVLMICLLEDRRSFCNSLENLQMMLKHYAIRA